ncbi:MAG: histidine kinase, partial [Nitrosarchaeum sp.]
TVIFDLTEMNDEKITEFEKYFKDSKNKLDEIKNNEYNKLDKNSKSEYDGLKKMFDMLVASDLREIRK